MADKHYINGIIINEHEFDNGGKIMKVAIKVDEFINHLKSCDNDQDFPEWVNTIIARRKTPSDKGITHYMYEDEWKPEPKQREVQNHEHNGVKDYNDTNDPLNDDEDLPF